MHILRPLLILLKYWQDMNSEKYISITKIDISAAGIHGSYTSTSFNHSSLNWTLEMKVLYVLIVLLFLRKEVSQLHMKYLILDSGVN